MAGTAVGVPVVLAVVAALAGAAELADADDGAWDFPRRLRRQHDGGDGRPPDRGHLRLRMELLAGRAMAYGD